MDAHVLPSLSTPYSQYKYKPHQTTKAILIYPKRDSNGWSSLLTQCQSRCACSAQYGPSRPVYADSPTTFSKGSKTQIGSALRVCILTLEGFCNTHRSSHWSDLSPELTLGGLHQSLAILTSGISKSVVICLEMCVLSLWILAIKHFQRMLYLQAIFTAKHCEVIINHLVCNGLPFWAPAGQGIDPWFGTKIGVVYPRRPSQGLGGKGTPIYLPGHLK